MTHNIAITGANGYIGKTLVNYFLANHHKVNCLGRKSTHSNAHFIPFELGGANDYRQLSGIDILIHCAYDFSLRKLTDIQKINIDGTLDLFNAARKFGVKLIIHLSTTSAFMDAHSNYGKTKYQLEEAAKKYDVIIIRPGLVFSKNAGGIVGALNKLAQKLPVIPIIGNGNQKFYPCHVNDLTRLVDHLMMNPIINQPIIAAHETPITFKQILQTYAKLYQKRILFIPTPYHLIYLGFKSIELLGLQLGLRSDSLKYLRQEIQLDFNATKKTGIQFSTFNTETLLN